MVGQRSRGPLWRRSSREVVAQRGRGPLWRCTLRAGGIGATHEEEESKTQKSQAWDRAPRA